MSKCRKCKERQCLRGKAYCAECDIEAVTRDSSDKPVVGECFGTYEEDCEDCQICQLSHVCIKKSKKS